MLASCSSPAAASAPTARLPRRRHCRPAAAVAQARPPARRLTRPVRAQQQGGEEALSDKGGAAQPEDFAKLASQAAGLLASEFASNENSVYDKLERWLVGSHDEEAEQLPPRTDQTTEESDAGRLIRTAAERFGMPTTVADAVESVKSWLANPSHAEEGHDVQMVARLVHRLLQAYQTHTGQDFDGEQEHQYDQLYSLATKVLGSSLSKPALKTLVRAYLGI